MSRRPVRSHSPGSWRELSADRGSQAVAAVPVVYAETVYGVVVVHSTRLDAFDQYERDLLRELGLRAGHAIDAAENRRLLHTDTAVELELEIADPSLSLLSATSALDCRMELESLLPGRGERGLAYQSVTGADPTSVAARLEDSEEFAAVRVVASAKQSGTLECQVLNSPLTSLVRNGATIRSATADAGTLRAVAEICPETDPYAVYGALDSAYTGTTLVAKRNVDRPVQGGSATQAGAGPDLTDRQWEALEVAYRGGFFASPRHSTGEDLAEAMGISSPTFYQHVRRGTERLLDYFDEQDALPDHG
jgi:hypothetical protein